MPTRRDFLTAGAMAGVTLHSGRVAEVLAAIAGDNRPATLIARDEDFWVGISRAFTVDRSLVNLNNGGVSPAPAMVQEAMKRHLEFSNEAPAYTMWRVLDPQREGVRAQLARQLGCSRDEIAITRNASEGLQICQFGFDLKRGDVVLTTDQDYPRMLTTFEQRQRREGIQLRKFAIPTPCDDPQRVVERFADNIARHQPRLILTSHATYTTGQILPVRAIVALAREHDIPVIIDGAHAFAHADFRIGDLGCDYYATSLHKWLAAPHGTGMLYVKKDKVKDLWPLMAAPERLADDIRKFEEIGTHPAANSLAIAEALTFHQGIGSRRKQERLTYLREHWIERTVDRFPDKFKLHTSRAPGQAFGIATVQLLGTKSTKLSRWLWTRHRILVTQIVRPDFEGIRVSPSVYTTLPELDRFCDAMARAAEHGIE